MAPFVIRLTVSAPVARVWAVVTDFAGYGRWIPATRMTHDPGSPGPGWRFAGHTGVGPVRFADPMVIEHWSPPGSGPDAAGSFRVRKTGRLLAGWAEVHLAPQVRADATAQAGCQLTWTEEILLRPPVLGRAWARLTDPLNRMVFARAVARMAEQATVVRG